MSVAPPSSFRDPFAPQSRPLPPPPEKPLSKRPLFWVAVGVGALVVIAASTTLTVLFWPRPSPVLPYESKRLPESVQTVRRSVRDKGVPLEVVASELAFVCGGTDVIGLSIDIERPYAREALADAIADKDETAKALRCGITLAKALDRKPRYTVGIEDDKHVRDVRVFPLSLEALPASTKTLAQSGGPKSLAAIACYRSEGNGSCASHQRAIAKIPGTTLWLSGRLADIDVVASSYSGRAADDHSRAFADLAPRFEAFESVTLGTSESGFYFRALSTLDDFGTDTRKARDAFKKALERADAVFAFGESIELLDEDRDVLEITTHREEDAKEVESTLKDLRLALKHAKDRKMFDDLPRVARKAQEAHTELYRRAIEDAEVEREGTTVKLVVPLKPLPAEKAALLEQRKDTADRTKHAIALYQAILTGKSPSDEVIQAIGGADLAHAVEDRKAGPPAAHDDPRPPTEVPNVEGFVLPAGATPLTEDAIAAKNAKSLTFIYKNATAGMIDDITGGLRRAGWSLHARIGFEGPIYECTKDDQTVELEIAIRSHEIAAYVQPE